MIDITQNHESPVDRVSAKPCLYALVTAAYNEEENIGATLQSVVAQTVLPERWVIVSDGSTDKTDEIVSGFAKTHTFIQLLRIERKPGRSFGSKVRAIHQGHRLLQDLAPEYVGNLDADITVDPSYYANLIEQFKANPQLGIAGGYVCEEENGTFSPRRSNRTYSVAHAAQLVRRPCYDDIGGYAVLEFGGEDWQAQISAEMKGWGTQAFPELRIFHHRHTGEADHLLRYKFRQGRMDYSLGSDPLFEILKCTERIPEKPFFLGSASRFTGFLWSWLRRAPRPVSAEFIQFLRKDQRHRVHGWIHGNWSKKQLRSQPE